MKKLFIMAVAALAMASCGSKSEAALDEAQSDSLNTVVETLKAGIETAAPVVKEAIENDSELKALVEKATTGEISEQEKATLWQKLKVIGSNAILGNTTIDAAANDALNEIKSADTEEVTGAASDAAAAVGGEDAAAKVNEAVEKAQEVKQTAETVKESAEQTKAAVDAAKNALNALKK